MFYLLAVSRIYVGCFLLVLQHLLYYWLQSFDPRVWRAPQSSGHGTGECVEAQGAAPVPGHVRIPQPVGRGSQHIDHGSVIGALVALVAFAALRYRRVRLCVRLVSKSRTLAYRKIDVPSFTSLALSGFVTL